MESLFNALMALIIRGPTFSNFDIYLTKSPNAEEEAAMALLILGRFVLLQLDLKKKLRYRRISS